MPTYAYVCTECGHAFDIHQSFSDDALTVCPQCEGRLRRVFSSVGVVFKGSGFYRTDSRSGKSSSTGAAPSGSTSGGDGSSSAASAPSTGASEGSSSAKPSKPAAAPSTPSTSSSSSSTASKPAAAK